ncbi:MAG: hypothetical protein LKG11_05270 [Bacilli bacterium]|jgi:hypothetical protein|nr:hypothetical protein [Bacilli bacterium]
MDDLSTVIIGYDSDADIWPVFNRSFSDHWANDQYSTVFVSITKRNRDFAFGSVTTDGDKSFSGRLQKGLDSVHGEFVLLLLHDYWLYDTPKSSDLNRFCVFMKESKVDYLQLGTMMENKLKGKKTSFPGYCFVPPKRRYRLNLQQGIWRKSFLQKLISEHSFDSTWDFEVFFMNDENGKRISENAKVFFPIGYTFPTANGLEKGQVCYQAQIKIPNSYLYQLSSRSFETKKEYKKRHRFDGVSFPNWLRSFAKSIGRFLGRKYYSN